MVFQTFCKSFALPVIAGALTSCVPKSAAQLTVFDPSNLQQNLLAPICPCRAVLIGLPKARL